MKKMNAVRYKYEWRTLVFITEESSRDHADSATMSTMMRSVTAAALTIGAARSNIMIPGAPVMMFLFHIGSMSSHYFSVSI